MAAAKSGQALTNTINARTMISTVNSIVTEITVNVINAGIVVTTAIEMLFYRTLPAVWRRTDACHEFGNIEPIGAFLNRQGRQNLIQPGEQA